MLLCSFPAAVDRVFRTTRFLLKYNKRDTKDKQLEQRLEVETYPIKDECHSRANYVCKCADYRLSRDFISGRQSNSDFKLWFGNVSNNRVKRSIILHAIHLRLAFFRIVVSQNAFACFSNEKYSFHQYFYLRTHVLFELCFYKILFQPSTNVLSLQFNSSNVKWALYT